MNLVCKSPISASSLCQYTTSKQTGKSTNNAKIALAANTASRMAQAYSEIVVKATRYETYRSYESNMRDTAESELEAHK